MSCRNHEEQTNCLQNLLELILKLQNCQEECDFDNNGCDKPYLGPTPNIVFFNTRPIRFFRCLDGEARTFPFINNGTGGTSDIFRVENIDDNCVTLRILTENPDTTNQASPFIATNSFVTLNLNCVGAVSCLEDVFVPNL